MIKFEHPNKFLLKNIVYIFFVAGSKQEAYSDENGEVYTDISHYDTIYAQHSLYPDIVTLVKDKKNDNNRFTLTLNPSLEKVSFEGIIFKIADDKVITRIPDYFMEMPGIEFVKQ